MVNASLFGLMVPEKSKFIMVRRYAGSCKLTLSNAKKTGRKLEVWKDYKHSKLVPMTCFLHNGSCPPVFQNVTEQCNLEMFKYLNSL